MDDSYSKFDLLWNKDIKFSQDEIDKYSEKYIEIRKIFNDFKDKIKAQQSLSKKMVDFEQPSTSDQPSTSEQPSAEEELPEYSQSGYAQTNISLPASEK